MALSDQGWTHATMPTPINNPHRFMAPSEYNPTSVGHGSIAVITIQTLITPSIQAPIPDKAMALLRLPLTSAPYSPPRH
jgi:hypothetical protein